MIYMKERQKFNRRQAAKYLNGTYDLPDTYTRKTMKKLDADVRLVPILHRHRYTKHQLDVFAHELMPH